MSNSGEIGLGSADVIRGQLVLSNNGKGVTPPKNIITNLYAARAIYYKYRAEHIKRIQLYALIEGLIAGNPPYNPAELAKHGLSHIANFNPLDARALYERGALAYWNLLNEAEVICKFTINSPDPQAREFEDVISEEWDTVVRKWESFETLMGTLSGQLVKFGISPILWPDERDWRWRVIELSKFFIPDQAQSDIEQLTAVCVESTFTAQYLFEVYDQYKDVPKDETPWNCDQLAQLLYFVANTFAKTNYEFIDFMDLQKRLQNGDIGYDVLFSDSIRIVSLFYKEYDGRFSHYMFHRTWDNGDFIYFADRQFENLQSALVIFTASPGEYTIHSNRGLGHKIFAPSQAQMQLDCSIIDGARWACTPLIKGVATGSKDVEQIRFYPGVVTNIGTAEFVQNNLGANINPLIEVSQYLTQKIQYNTANSGDDPGIPDRNVGSISPSQARMQSYREFGVLKNNIAHYYNFQDRVFQNMTIKMLKSKEGYPGYEYAHEWKQRCLDRGVPESVFSMGRKTPWGMPRMLSVKATRVAGDGSTLGNIMGLQELMPISSDFGPKEAREFKRQWIMAARGKDQVSAFMQDPSDVDATSGGASLAQQENNAMQNGQGALFSPDNDNQAHFTIHMALASNTIEALQQQQTDPVAADKVFTVLVPHLEEHWNAIVRSIFGKKFVSQHQKSFHEVVQYATLNHKNAAKMLQAQLKQQQQAQAQQEQAMSDAQRKDFIAKADMQRNDAKTQASIERADKASETRAQVAHEKVLSEADNNRLKIQLEANNKSEVASKDLSAQISNINGNTPAPYDIEGTHAPVNLVTGKRNVTPGEFYNQ